MTLGRRIRGAMLVLGGVLLPLAVPHPAQAAFGYRRLITIDGTRVVGAGHTDFPVLVSVQHPDLRTAPAGHVQSPSGHDIGFMASTGGALLEHEIERYDGATGSLVAWVRIPLLSGPANTTFYLYYGDPDITCAKNSPALVWASGYRYVYHFNQAGAANPYDSTGNAVPAVRNPTADAGIVNAYASGITGGALDLVSSPFVNPPQQFLPTTPTHVRINDAALANNQAYTLEGWFFMRTVDPGFVGILSKNRDGGVADWVGLYKFNNGFAPPRPLGLGNNTGGNVGGTTTLAAGQWYYGAVTWDGTNRRVFRYDVNETTNATAVTLTNVVNPARVGDDSNGRYLDGLVDEIRFSNGARSVAWLQTTARNQACPSSSAPAPACAAPLPITTPFLSLGAEQAPPTNYRSIGAAGSYTTGSVTLTAGSTTVNGTGGTAWLTANRGRGDSINVNSGAFVGTVLAVSANNQLTLASPSTITGTFATYSISRKFPTLAAWEDCIDGGGTACGPDAATASGDLRADDRREVGIAYRDGAFDQLTFSGPTTGPFHDITLTADSGNRHNGVAGAGVTLANTSSSNAGILVNGTGFLTVEWMEVSGGGGTVPGIEVGPTSLTNRLVVRNCVVQGVPGHGILDSDTDHKVDLYDNIVYNTAGSGIVFTAALSPSQSVARVVNNTVYNAAQDGIASTGGFNGTLFVRNNIAWGSVGDDFSVPGAGTASHNLSSDATAPGASSLTSVPLTGVGGVNFVSTTPSAENLHLTTGTSPASVATDAGTMLTCVLQRDVDDAARFYRWDIGADEVGLAVVGTSCPVGQVPSGPNFVVHGTFDVLDGGGPASNGFTSSVPYNGDNTCPPDTRIAIRNVTGFCSGTAVLQSPFPGDPSAGIPATPTWLAVNGNNTGGPYVAWRQTVTGLQPSRTYVFYFYASNANNPPTAPSSLSTLRLCQGVTGTGPFACAAQLNPSDFVIANESAGTGDVWRRYQVTFTTGAAQTTADLAILNAAPGASGDDLSLSQVGAQVCTSTTAVTLESFTATPADGAVDLAWTTATELSNLGFHLHRSESAEGPFERITSSLIPGLGSSVVGRSYAYRDAGLVNGRTYHYILEDLETSGRTERHGPVSATPAAAPSPPSCCGAPPDPQGPAGTIHGDPASVVLREVERSPRHVVLELLTGGFVAFPAENGRVRLSIPGFETASRPGEPSLPMRRALVEAAAGRTVRLVSAVASGDTRFPGLRPVPEGRPRIQVSEEGLVRPSEERRPEGPAFRDVFPKEPALLLGTAFQGETKKAEVLLFPLRWDGSGLVHSRRLLVRLEFAGKDVRESSRGGSRGRRKVARTSHSRTGVVAQLTVRERGLYRVDYEDVFPAGRQPRGLAPSSLRLSRQGETVAYHLSSGVFGPGSSLFFLSEGASLNPYADAVYELETSVGGLVMEETLGSPTASRAVREYLETVRREENYYFQAGLLEAPDPWLWALALHPGAYNVATVAFSADRVSPSSTPGALHLVLQGGSDIPGVVDHHVRVRVNGVVVGETEWDGATEHVLDLPVPGGAFAEGTNNLSLENVGDTGASSSMVFLNRFDVSYPRRLVSVQGRLEGRFEATGPAEIEGASPSSVVLDTTDTPRWLRGASATPAGLSLDVQAGRSYLVTSNVLRPAVKRLSPSTLKSPANQADYVLLGPAAFLPAAQPLLELRQSQGLVTRAVSLEEVYEQFGHGEVSPEAIKEFLEYAYHSWAAPSVRYVLLLGDASYDPKNYLGTGVKDWLPGFPVVTSYIQTVSDPAYASVNGTDLLPDLAMGRLPAASLGEAQGMVEKILLYENGGGRLDGPAVLVADNADAAGNFEANADDLAATVLASRNPRKIYYSAEGAATRAKILQAFDDGASLVSYVGHGSTTNWASEGFFKANDVPALQAQSIQPLLLTLNCLNGFFHFPGLNSLSEAMLKAEGKGAVAAFSPSGLSVNDPAHVFHKAVLREVVSGDHERLGDALLAAQEAYSETGAFPELLSIYHLFGDPALRIR